MAEEFTPCETCGTPTAYVYTGLCINCWELQARIPTYLKSENGRRHVLNLLLTEDLANAIIDMDNHGYSECLGPDTQEGTAAWNKLLEAAEVKAGRQTDEHRAPPR